MAKPKRRGRKPLGEYAGKSTVMNFRIMPDTRAALVRASEESGRSLSQETEHRLRRDLFQHGSAQTHAVLRTIGFAIDGLVNIKNPKANWLDDPYLFQQARQAITTLLDLFKPDAAAPNPEESSERGGRMQGNVAIRELLARIQLAEPKPRPKQTAEERALLVLKSDLRDLAERPRPYGKSAAQLRKEAKAARKQRGKS